MTITKGSLIEMTHKKGRYTAVVECDFDPREWKPLNFPVVITAGQQRPLYVIDSYMELNLLRPGRWRLPTKSHIRFKRLRTREP